MDKQNCIIDLIGNYFWILEIAYYRKARYKLECKPAVNVAQVHKVLTDPKPLRTHNPKLLWCSCNHKLVH